MARKERLKIFPSRCELPLMEVLIAIQEPDKIPTAIEKLMSPWEGHHELLHVILQLGAELDVVAENGYETVEPDILIRIGNIGRDNLNHDLYRDSSSLTPIYEDSSDTESDAG